MYMQGNWTVCVPLMYLMLMPDIQEAKCFEFTVHILPPPLGAPRGGTNFAPLLEFTPCDIQSSNSTIFQHV